MDLLSLHILMLSISVLNVLGFGILTAYVLTLLDLVLYWEMIKRSSRRDQEIQLN